MSVKPHHPNGPPRRRIALLITIATATGLILFALLQFVPRGPSVSGVYLSYNKPVSVDSDAQPTSARIDFILHWQSFGWPLKSNEHLTNTYRKTVDGERTEFTPDDIAGKSWHESFVAPGEARRTWKLGALELNALFFIIIANGPLAGWLLWRRRRGTRRLRRSLCIQCGYNLTGAVEHRCHECGSPLYRCPECGLPFSRDDGQS